MYIQRLLIQRIITVLAVVIACSLLPRFGLADPGFSFGDENLKNKTCLNCHKDKELVGAVNQINTKAFQHTTHALLGCKTCHDTISNIHPKDGKTTRTTTCSDCHADVAAEYSISKHSLSVTNCNACHNPHTVHKPGDVYALDLNETCTSCHNQDRITASHAQWLPQTNLHLGSITCTTCHTKSDNYVLSVYVSRRDQKKTGSNVTVADYSHLKNKAGSEDITKLVDRNLDSYISIEELRNFNSNPANKDLYLKAVLTPNKTTHAFQTSDKSWNCTACHAAGPDTAQVSRLVLPMQDGTFQHLNIEKGASIATLNVIPDFYMMGSSRSTIMNMLGAVVLAGGMVMPVGHGFIRFLTRKNRKKE